jgi:LAO/AO transport system kinase
VSIDPEDLAKAIRAGERRALARGITLIESRRADHREAAEALLTLLLPEVGSAVRLGISGAPGAGKSTFIEAFGQVVMAEGKSIAVLAVDPTSQRSGGSILGDKTRMQTLAKAERAFVRPSPAGGTLGGIARRSQEVALLVEAAGFDVVVLETVGVGQSESAVADMVDCFLLLLAPGAGDELQGIKRGIMELADLVLVNKADGELLSTARLVAADYQAALKLLRTASAAWRPEVMTCSAREGEGVAEVWAAIGRHREALAARGALEAKRRHQHERWLAREIEACLMDALCVDPKTGALLRELRRAVADGEAQPPKAAHLLVERFRRDG